MNCNQNFLDKKVFRSPVKISLKCVKTVLKNHQNNCIGSRPSLTQDIVLEDQNAGKSRKVSHGSPEKTAASLPSAQLKLMHWFIIKPKEIFD